MGKNIIVGTGLSVATDPAKAASEAATQALKNLKGKKPIISYVFFAGYDSPREIEQLNDALMSTFKGSEFVGGSADAVYYDEKVIRRGVVIASIYSDYLHVSVSSSDNVSSDPYTVARKTAQDSLKKLSIDTYVDPYLLFTRMRKANVKWMVKLPSFFVTIFSRGMKLPKMGDETKIIKGVADEIGLNVPIWGGSFGTSLENLFGGKPYEIYMLHSGKILRDGLILVFNTGSLVYGQSLAHSARRTNKFGFISKVTGNGYVVEEISGENVIDWYCRQLNLKKEEFLKNSMTITQRYPLGIPDSFGNFIIRGAGVHSNGTLGYVAPCIEGWPVYIMDADPKYLLDTSKELAQDIKKYTEQIENPAVILAGLCASRRALLGDDIAKELKLLKKTFGNAPIVGYSCFGEIGSKPGMPTTFNHLTSNLFLIYDKLLHEL